MSAPIIILMTLVGTNLGASILYHGQTAGLYNAWMTASDTAILMGLLYWAGLFDL
jgi:hypothetical protein